jgi:transcriptional regulator with XRE-family HTH domain
MKWNSLSDTDIVVEIGKRLKEYRLKKRFTQQELAEMAGISIFSVAQIERGKAVSVSILLPVLRTLRLLENLELLLPEIGLSPVELLKLRGKIPKRIRAKKIK